MTIYYSVGMLLVLLVSIVGIYLPGRTLRRSFGAVFALISSVAYGLSIAVIWQYWSILLGLIGLIQLINCLRLVKDRMNLQQLRRKFTQTWLFTLLATSTLYVMSWLDLGVALNLWTVGLLLALSTFVVAAVLLLATLFHLKTTKPVRLNSFVSDRELPTLSVLIPARNEDADLADCIHGLLKSDYPKLEIIVLDDCSHDASSDIIKSFAHKGVRFIEGEVPREKWLAKNQAYQTLADAASGDWLLFSGVDVRFEVKTLRNIVTHALTKDKKMLGLLPIRSHMTWQTAWLSPLRYWYEMAFPRTAFGTPPVLSTCWLINKKLFDDVGGFRGVTRSVIPETYFAKLARKDGGYQFIRSSLDLVIRTEKSLREQYDTAIRTRYPQVHKSIEFTVLAGTGLLVLLLGTYGLSLVALLSGEYSVAVLAFVGALMLSASQVIITYVTCKKAVLVSFFAFPLLLAQEVVLLFISMYKYEFSDVDWKGRNICYPIMHVTPKLPSIDQ